VLPQLERRKDDWDNLSKDVQAEDATFEECRALCEAKTDCLQFSLDGSTCKSLNTIKLGDERKQRPDSEAMSQEEKEKNKKISSGWVMERVEAFMKELDESCSGQDWVAV